MVIIHSSQPMFVLGMSVLLKTEFPDSDVLNVDDFNELKRNLNHPDIKLIILGLTYSTELWIGELQCLLPGRNILLVSCGLSPVETFICYKIGVLGLLDFKAALEEIILAIKTVAAGRVYRADPFGQNMIANILQYRNCN